MRDLLPLPPSPQGLVVLAGRTSFAPSLISDLARRLGLAPQTLLRQIRISRVFTCYQLEALLEERLPRVRERLDPYGLFLSGALEAPLGEGVPAGGAGG